MYGAMPQHLASQYARQIAPLQARARTRRLSIGCQNKWAYRASQEHLNHTSGAKARLENPPPGGFRAYPERHQSVGLKGSQTVVRLRLGPRCVGSLETRAVGVGADLSIPGGSSQFA